MKKETIDKIWVIIFFIFLILAIHTVAHATGCNIVMAGYSGYNCNNFWYQDGYGFWTNDYCLFDCENGGVDLNDYLTIGGQHWPRLWMGTCTIWKCPWILGLGLWCIMDYEDVTDQDCVHVNEYDVRICDWSNYLGQCGDVVGQGHGYVGNIYDAYVPPSFTCEQAGTYGEGSSPLKDAFGAVVTAGELGQIFVPISEGAIAPTCFTPNNGKEAKGRGRKEDRETIKQGYHIRGRGGYEKSL